MKISDNLGLAEGMPNLDRPIWK